MCAQFFLFHLFLFAFFSLNSELDAAVLHGAVAVGVVCYCSVSG